MQAPTSQTGKAALASLRTVDAAMSVTGDYTTARALLYLASAHPRQVTMTELCQTLDLSKSRISRMVRDLYSVRADRSQGPDLIHIGFDPHNPRTKLVGLNDKGVRAICSIVQD